RHRTSNFHEGNRRATWRSENSPGKTRVRAPRRAAAGASLAATSPAERNLRAPARLSAPVFRQTPGAAAWRGVAPGDTAGALQGLRALHRILHHCIEAGTDIAPATASRRRALRGDRARDRVPLQEEPARAGGRADRDRTSRLPERPPRGGAPVEP